MSVRFKLSRRRLPRSTRHPRPLVVAVIIIAALVWIWTPAQIGQADTSSPSPTASPSPTPRPPSLFHGVACLDADCGGTASSVSALINGVQCAEVTVETVVDGPVSPETLYFIDVPPDSARAGCGVEGATVTFAVNGRPARQTGVWHFNSDQRLDLSAGEDFAAFSGQLLDNGQPVSLANGLPVLKAFIGGVDCGERTVSPGFAPNATSVSAYVLLIVLSNGSRPGCGTEGAAVSFSMNGRPAHETVTWTPGFHTQDLEIPLLSIASFGGHVCLDSDCRDAAVGKQIVATINGVQCARGNATTSPQDEAFFTIDVPAAANVAGCGTEGATVQFSIDGRPAKPTGVWHGGQSQTVDIWAGNDFAAFSGGLLINGEPFRLSNNTPLPELKAYVGSPECGKMSLEAPGLPTPSLPVPNYDLLIVLSDATWPGCGKEGSPITFTVNGFPADQTATWSPGFHKLDLSAAQPIVLPAGGGPPAGESTPWVLMAGGLAAILGIVCIAFAARKDEGRYGR